MPVTTERPIGVTVCAIMAIVGAVGSGSVLWGAVLLAPAFMRAVSFGTALFSLAIAAWAIATAVGLLKLRPWSRWSALIFNVLLVCVAGSAVVSTVLVPQRPTPPRAAPVSPDIMTGIRVGPASLFVVLALIGAFWLFYFNRAGVRARFGSGDAGTSERRGRPLSVSVIGWVMITGGALTAVVSTFMPSPGEILGITFGGAAGRLLYVVFGAIEVALGVGLLRLNGLCRVLAITWFVFMILNLAINAPVLSAIHEWLKNMPPGVQALGERQLIVAGLAGLIPGVLVYGIPIWFLIARRRAFRERA